jgi:2'-hydroxyisoflavone reductase
MDPKGLKKILILGGTQFIGRNLVEKLLAENEYELTLFNRQRTNADLFPQVKKLKGDRDTNDLDQIGEQDWDVVIDISCYLPAQLERTLERLKGKIRRYIFISTISVYDLKQDSGPLTEEMEILPCSAEERMDTSMKAYGQKKAECERILQNAKWLDAIILRPSIVYGKYDHTDRFYFWLYRLVRTEETLMPDGGFRVLSLTYIDDLCSTILNAISSEKHSRIYNVSTHDAMRFEEIIASIANAAGTSSGGIDISSGELEKFGVTTSQDIPLWFKIDLEVSNRKVKRELGMDFLPFEDSVKRLIEHFNNVGWHIPRAGISLEKENEILSSIWQ